VEENPCGTWDFIGATRRIRTDDLLITNHGGRPLPSVHALSNIARWPAQSNGKLILRVSISVVSSGGCVPLEIASTIDGAKNASGIMRLT
jgi:hypothetical protein